MWSPSDGYDDLAILINRSEPWPWSGASPIHLPASPLMRVMAQRLRTQEATTFSRFMHLFASECSKPGANTFVDSGSNEGIWSLLAAAHGCTVLAIEPQPYCRRLASAAAERSGLSASLTLLARVFSDGWEISRPHLCVPDGICRGTATYAHGRVDDIRNSTALHAELRRTRAMAPPCENASYTSLDLISEQHMNSRGSVALWHLDVGTCQSSIDLSSLLRHSSHLFMLYVLAFLCSPPYTLASPARVPIP